ncbi:GTP cyclohydrolase IIa [Brevibacillus daliensis]|uniref:GTP cyclohydrolase IIa n=1 Tax=Brevibacillus daliensis TaxID=2892995 RepID=UPI001E58CFE1|nr:GTP cyclohydrolase IIa [Brevibacillus daliensis]
MQITVGFFGPHDLLPEIMELSDSSPSICLRAFGYKEVSETLSLVQQHADSVDALLFAGPIPYQIGRRAAGKEKPLLYLPHDGSSLYRAFFHMLKNKGHSTESWRLSIDFLYRSEIEEYLCDLGINANKIYVKDYHQGMSMDEFLSFHLSLWEEGKIDATLTCSTMVYRELTNRGLACYRVIPTRVSMRKMLQQAELEVKSLRVSNSYLVIVIIHVDWMTNRFSSEYDWQRKKLLVQQILIQFGEDIQATLNWSNSDEFSFITTREAMANAADYQDVNRLIGRIMHEAQVTTYAGIGLGRTANEAERRAREALLQARTFEEGNCIILMQEGLVLGPLGKDSHLLYSARSDDPHRLKLSKNTGLSVGTINKLISLHEHLNEAHITALELANHFSITHRSARRILHKLEQAQVATVVGEEQPIGRGRPRQLYKLDFNQE